MPDGVVQWFDGSTGEAAVLRGGRVFPASLGDIDPAARHAGARVHFDIARDGGVERAVGVILRSGTHVSRRQHRFGTLTGARGPDDKGSAPFATPHPELGRDLAVHPFEVARSWARALTAGDLPSALAFYAPGAVVHADGVSYTGRSHLQAYWEASPLLGSGRVPRVAGDGDTVVVGWERVPGAGATTAMPAMEVRCRVEHGQVVEQQAVTPAEAPPVAEVAGPPGSGPVPVAVVTRGEVGAAEVEYGQQRLGQVVAQVGSPVLFARLKLTRAADPARERPAVAEGSLDVNGDLVRAHVAAHDMREAADLLERRLRDQLAHRAAHRDARRHDTGLAQPGEWRHGDLPTRRPEWFDRPVEERRLVRHKAFVVDELTAEEAAFDMEQLDYDFLLFRDLATGHDALIAATGDGYRLARVAPPGGEAASPAAREPATPGAAALAGPGGAAPQLIGGLPVIEVPDATPVLRVDEAIERLDVGADRLVFFANASTGRGNVLYRRYDGHYGLITPD